MKVTRDILDNGKKIVHINYTKNEIAAIVEENKKRAAEAKAKAEAEAEADASEEQKTEVEEPAEPVAE